MLKPFVNGSVEWLLAFRDGVFSNLKPLPWEPPQKAKPIPVAAPVIAKAVTPLRPAPGRCTYCERPMERRSRSRLAATRDHTWPKSWGGRITVPCCRQCNEIKGNMHPADWEAFMERFPEWWLRPEFRRIGDHVAARLLLRRSDEKPTVIPYEQSMMIMRHGKDHWRAWKLSGNPICECCRRPPLPIEYDDPKKQAAFEGAYRDRAYMLRVPAV